VYKSFIQYLYTGTVNPASLEDAHLLGEFELNISQLYVIFMM